MTLSTAYFPPVDYFAVLANNPSVYLEACESYRKQTWRNRCRILTEGGPMDLRVPVVHGPSRLITDIRVDWSTPWLRQTQYAIDTAYYSSPFFEYYRDELFSLMDRQRPLLWDLNMDIIRFFCAKIGIAPRIEPTSCWLAEVDGDLRDIINPKRPPVRACRPYWQVFRERYGFTDGLSVMDLLFNEGPESLGYLMD
ncbi:MAG: WbqC family protein [Bacteroidales bacterium]|nr:WbqC family protein [Bacteroidales bacterium]